MEQLEVLIVGNYGPGNFIDLPPGVRVHLHSPGDRRSVPSLERIEAVVGGWFPPEWMEHAPNLRYFFIPFAGLSPELRRTLSCRPGVTVANTHVASEYVAEHVFACLFRLNRNLESFDRYMRRPRALRRSIPDQQIVTLRGKTMGVVGRGHLGTAVERIGTAFGTRVRTYTHADFRAEGPGRKERLLAFLSDCDFVVLAVPLTEETTGLLAEEELSAMRPEALLINVSRGEIVQEKALYRALKKKTIRGAAVDTWYNYRDGFFNPDRPYTRNFRRFPNLVMTPHVACRSRELDLMRIEEIRNFIRTVHRGESPASLVNLQAGY